MRYEAKLDGTLANSKLFFDMTAAPGEDALDGSRWTRRRISTSPAPAGCG